MQRRLTRSLRSAWPLLLAMLALSLTLSSCCDHAQPLPELVTVGLPSLPPGPASQDPPGDPIAEAIRRMDAHGWTDAVEPDGRWTRIPTADLQYVLAELHGWRVHALALRAAGRWAE